MSVAVRLAVDELLGPKGLTARMKAKSDWTTRRVA